MRPPQYLSTDLGSFLNLSSASSLLGAMLNLRGTLCWCWDRDYSYLLKLGSEFRGHIEQVVIRWIGHYIDIRYPRRG